MRRRREEVPKEEKATQVVFKLQRRALDARPIARFFPDDWQALLEERTAPLTGAIVQLYPPATATPTELERVLGLLRVQAAKVVVMPAAAAANPIPKGSEKEQAARERDEAVPAIREVVDKMVEDAKTEHREELRAFVEECLASEGL